MKPRICISTDIGGGDPDDFQSLVHYLVYSDLFDTEAIISSPPDFKKESIWFRGRKEHILEVVDVYEDDYHNLKMHGDYPLPSDVRSVSAQGAIDGGMPSVGKQTEGSELLIKCARKEDRRPLWILGWGALTDVAQALFDAPDIVTKIRLYSIGSWNTYAGDQLSRNYIAQNHKNLWWIENDFTFRGMYNMAPEHGEFSNRGFVDTHIKGHGALGNFAASKMNALKMGDTPSVLFVLSPLIAGVGSWDDPTRESWGGEFKLSNNGEGLGPQFWTDIYENEKLDGKSIDKWREMFLTDWALRMDRCKAGK